MILLFCLILTTISLLIFFLIKNKNLSIGKNLLITVLCTFLILSIVLKPETSLNSTLTGVRLFVNSVFVSIFPFLVLINIMMHYDGVHIYSKVLGNILCKPFRLPKECSVVLTVSILCGYPLGAKYACDLYEKGVIDHDTCERLISIASNPSPLFVIGAVGTSMLKNPTAGLLLLISSYLSCAVMAMLIPPPKPSLSNKKIYVKDIGSHQLTIGDVLKSSIDNAFKISISIGGFIIFFSVISSIIKNNILLDIVLKYICVIFNLQKEVIQGFLLGLVEMTNGCSLLSNLSLNDIYKLIIISFLVTFSGLSIISQTYSITYKYDFSLKLYIRRKLIQGFISSIITLALFNLNIFSNSKSVFNTEILGVRALDINTILILEMLILLLPIIIKKLFHRIS